MDDLYTIALFGEAEKGEYQMPYFLNTLVEMAQFLGNQPGDSRGLYFAVQALLYKRKVIFLRVEEEGYSTKDYLAGVALLKNQKLGSQVNAICMPGVGQAKILTAFQPICDTYHSILITNEADLYDYITG